MRRKPPPAPEVQILYKQVLSIREGVGDLIARLAQTEDIARKATAELAELRKAHRAVKRDREDLIAHLDWIGWGDHYERECSEALRKRVRAA